MFSASPFTAVPFTAPPDDEPEAGPVPSPDPSRATWARRGIDPSRTIAMRRRSAGNA